MKPQQSRPVVSVHRGTWPARFCAALLGCVASPAFAQISKVNTTMEAVETVLVGVSVTVFTIALLWVAYKMAFQHAKWAEVMHIVIGGIIAGGAPGISAWLIN